MWTEALQEGGGRIRIRSGRCEDRAEVEVMPSEDGRKALEPRQAGGLLELGRQGDGFSPEAPPKGSCADTLMLAPENQYRLLASGTGR